MPNAKLDTKELLKEYGEMLLIRRFEEAAAKLYGMAEIAGFCHLYIGQEAVAAGMRAVMESEDKLITSYRCHGHLLIASTDYQNNANGIMAELCGRIDGNSKGKGGSMHIFDLANHVYGGHGIVGAQVSIGTGLALAEKYRETKNVVICYMGEGALNQGQVYESFNMAKLWGLPIVYVVENNLYALGTSCKRHSATPDTSYKRGESFGIPGMVCDGQDINAVKETGKKAVDYVRENSSPMLVEMHTYRYKGHSMSDPALYRTKEEVESYKTNRDPIDNFGKFMIDNKVATEEELKAIDKMAKEIAKNASEFALNSPKPGLEELETDVYA